MKRWGPFLTRTVGWLNDALRSGSLGDPGAVVVQSVINDDALALFQQFFQVIFEEVGELSPFETQRFLDDVAGKGAASLVGTLYRLQMRQHSGKICKKQRIYLFYARFSVSSVCAIQLNIA